MSQWNCWGLEIGMLHSLLIQWNGSEVINFTNFSKILLKFAIVFKIFEYFCVVFWVLRSLLANEPFYVLQIGYMTETRRQKLFLNLFFIAKCGNLFWLCTFSFFYDLITNNARKLEVAESNLIMENILSSLSLSLCVCVWVGGWVLVGVSFLLFRVHV